MISPLWFDLDLRHQVLVGGNGKSSVSTSTYGFALSESIDEPQSVMLHPKKLPRSFSSSWSETRIVQVPTGFSFLNANVRVQLHV